MSGDHDDYTVGYKKPPKQSQFRKGQSGNRSGRPKGTKNLKTDLREELQETILVREGEGGARRISKQRALYKSLTAKGIKGDTRAAVAVLVWAERLLGADGPEAAAPLAAEERAILETLEARLLRRLGRTAATDAPATPPRSKKKTGGTP